MKNSFDCVGVDVFLRIQDFGVSTPAFLQKVTSFELKALSNRGTRVWPGDRPNFELTDIFRARFMPKTTGAITQDQIVGLLTELNKLNVEWVHLEKLHRLDDKNVFSEMQ